MLLLISMAREPVQTVQLSGEYEICESCGTAGALCKYTAN